MLSSKDETLPNSEMQRRHDFISLSSVCKRQDLKCLWMKLPIEINPNTKQLKISDGFQGFPNLLKTEL